MRTPKANIVALALAVVLVHVTAGSAQVDEAKSVFDALYGAKVKAAQATRDPADDVALAGQILEAARTSTDQVKLLAVMCDNVYTLGAADPTGHAHAVDAMRLLAATDPPRAGAAMDNIVELRRKQFAKAKADERATAGGLLVDAMLDAAQVKTDASDFAGAATILRQAMTIARQVKAPNAEDVRLRLEQTQARQRVQDRITALAAKLLASAGDKAAATELVMLYMVELDDARGAMKYADQTGDDKLKRRVPLAAANSTELTEPQALEMAGWYRELSAPAQGQIKQRLLQHAVACYERYLALHTDQDVARKGAELAMAEARKASDALTATKPAPTPTPVTPSKTAKSGPKTNKDLDPDKPLATNKWIDVLPLVDLAKHTAKGAFEARKGQIVFDRKDTEGWFYIPITIKGEYELKFDMISNGDAGIYGAYLPTDRGYAALSYKLNRGDVLARGGTATFGVTILADKVQVLFSDGMNNDVTTDYAFDKMSQRPPIRVTDSVLIILAKDMTVTFRSIQIRVAKGGEARILKEAPAPAPSP